MTPSTAMHSAMFDLLRRSGPNNAGTGRLSVCALLALALMSGCATHHQPRAGSSPSAYPGALLAKRSLAVNVSEPPAFYADTTERRFFGILGAFSMRSAGMELVSRYGLRDPSTTVATELKQALMTGHGMVETTGTPDLVLDVDTVNWDFRPFRGNAHRMYVVYSGRARLTDTRLGRVVAEGVCRSVQEPDGNAATVDTLLANGARVLREELQDAGRDCARRLQVGALSMVMAPGRQVAAVSEDKPAQAH